MRKKNGGLGLVDPEAAKSSLMCKWIVKAMEPGESNLQTMLRYRLARFNPHRGKSWRVSLDWFTCKNHIEVAALRCGIILVKLGKSWKKVFTNSPLAVGWNCSTPIFGGQTEWISSITVLNAPKDWNSIVMGLNVWMTFGTTCNGTFSHGRRLSTNMASLQRMKGIGKC